ncbi:hypothetical protein KFU94_17630 [Chloroflexi bacterium TSY]|nr:hypothetical protein [Chloroflexi bacterium TSY]
MLSLQSIYTGMIASTQRGAVNTIEVLDIAGLPSAPQDSGLLVNVLMAAALGFVLSASGAYLLEFLDDTIKTQDDGVVHFSWIDRFTLLETERTFIFSDFAGSQRENGLI